LQWSSGAWVPRIDSWRACEAGRWVIRTGVAPAARKRGSRGLTSGAGALLRAEARRGEVLGLRGGGASGMRDAGVRRGG